MKEQQEWATFDQLLDLLSRLDDARIHYQLASTRPESIMVAVAVPGERWEIEFMGDGDVEIETFVSSGEIADRSLLVDLFQRFSD